jgi:VanZ family protein
MPKEILKSKILSLSGQTLITNHQLLQKLYKLLFWIGYTAVLATSMMNIGGNLNAIKVDLLIFKLRLDQLLHFLVYFLICMYFMAGQRNGFVLFKKHPQWKYTVATLTLATVSEVVQLWVPSRAFNVLDWVANVSGILVGILVIKIADSRLKS